MSRFADVDLAPPIEVFLLNKAFADDDSKEKVILGAGAYRTDEGKPWVLPVVRHAERQIALDETLDKEYLPMLGTDSFTQSATKLLLGAQNEAIVTKRAAGIQALSGTGALRIGAEFLTRVLGYKIWYYSNPSWENHHLLAKFAGFQEIRQYRYWSSEKKGLDIEGMLQDLREAPENSVIVLHACAHNPTGCDPTQEQWKQIADIIEERKLFPFMDSAYQGFASGDLDKDAWAVRYFVSRGFEMFCAQSFSKNFGLYNERIGNLTVVAENASVLTNFKSQMNLIVRSSYSNPPSHGGRIVTCVLNNNDLFEEWKQNILVMSTRIIQMRQLLRAHLEKLETPGSWDHITSQIGMFSYTGLTEAQAQRMIEKHHIYLLRSGRISMAGVNPSNVKYVAKCIHECVVNTSNKL